MSERFGLPYDCFGSDQSMVYCNDMESGCPCFGSFCSIRKSLQGYLLVYSTGKLPTLYRGFKGREAFGHVGHHVELWYVTLKTWFVVLTWRNISTLKSVTGISLSRRQ